MPVQYSELGRMRESFPDINTGGNLVFCTLADQSKLSSLLRAGIIPRERDIQGGSFFPDVVSLAATGLSFDASTSYLWGAFMHRQLFRPEAFITKPFKYALVLDPKSIQENSHDFLFVGKDLVGREKFRTGPLKDVPIADPYITDATFNEVHYLAGSISPASLVGVAISELNETDFQSAVENVRRAVRNVKQIPNQLPSQIGLYDAQGELFDIAI